jgi:ABC-type ATPase with predicted acetyltransferase domain
MRLRNKRAGHFRARPKPGQSGGPPRVQATTWRTERIVNWFGLTNPRPETPEPRPEFPPQPGQILLLTGASGSGKSTLLRQLVADLHQQNIRTIDLGRLPLPDVPVVDCLPDLSLEAALMLLGRMGLGEAWTYLRTPTELSDGQRWRLRLCLAVHEAGRYPNEPVVLVCDEYAALLDRLTAAVVSRSIRKLITALPRLSAVLATCHDDVVRPLSPDRVVLCDFGYIS